MTDQIETFSDRMLDFTLPARDARGRIVRLDAVLDEILSAHNYPSPITHLLAEALVIASLIGGLLKDANGQITMQAQTEGGAVRLLVCDYREGQLRGYIDYDSDALASLGSNPSLFALFGKGYLAITIDRPQPHGRYQGIVPLEGNSLASACENYFVQSEQVPTLIRLAVRSDDEGCLAAGLLVQHLPDGEEGRERLSARLDHPEWEHVSILAGSVRHDELLDHTLSMEGIVWRLFHEEDEVRVAQGAGISRGCRCSEEHYSRVLAGFSKTEREEMRDEEGNIRVDCAFCSKTFAIEL